MDALDDLFQRLVTTRQRYEEARIRKASAGERSLVRDQLPDVRAEAAMLRSLR